MNQERIEHLEMIQGIINRLSHNSFLLKGWTVVLLSGLFSLAALDSEIQFALVSYIPIAMFWLLDAYFLRQERLFRQLYEQVRTERNAESDFSMDTHPVADRVGSVLSVAASATLIWFYGILLSTTVLITLIGLRIN